MGFGAHGLFYWQNMLVYDTFNGLFVAHIRLVYGVGGWVSGHGCKAGVWAKYGVIIVILLLICCPVLRYVSWLLMGFYKASGNDTYPPLYVFFWQYYWYCSPLYR